MTFVAVMRIQIVMRLGSVQNWKSNQFWFWFSATTCLVFSVILTSQEFAYHTSAVLSAVERVRQTCQHHWNSESSLGRPLHHRRRSAVSSRFTPTFGGTCPGRPHVVNKRHAPTRPRVGSFSTVLASSGCLCQHHTNEISPARQCQSACSESCKTA